MYLAKFPRFIGMPCGDGKGACCLSALPAAELISCARGSAQLASPVGLQAVWGEPSFLCMWNGASV